MGKTHLMQAIGRELMDRYATMRVVYTTSERFMNEMITCIRTERHGDPRRGSYPLEWLHAGNANLSAQDIKALEAQLQIPSESERKGFSLSLTESAEAASSAGRMSVSAVIRQSARRTLPAVRAVST